MIILMSVAETKKTIENPRFDFKFHSLWKGKFFFETEKGQKEKLCEKDTFPCPMFTSLLLCFLGWTSGSRRWHETISPLILHAEKSTPPFSWIFAANLKPDTFSMHFTACSFGITLRFKQREMPQAEMNLKWTEISFFLLWHEKKERERPLIFMQRWLPFCCCRRNDRLPTDDDDDEDGKRCMERKGEPGATKWNSISDTIQEWSSEKCFRFMQRRRKGEEPEGNKHKGKEPGSETKSVSDGNNRKNRKTNCSISSRIYSYRVTCAFFSICLSLHDIAVAKIKQ